MGSAPLTATAFKDDGVVVAVGTSTGLVELYDLRMPEARMAVFDGANREPIESLAFQMPKSSSAASSKATSKVRKQGSRPYHV
jgi:hypothetical protein